MTAPLLQAEFRAGYGRQAVVDGLAFAMHAGDRLGLVGTSGTGKSTLALSLLGLLPWKRGWTTGRVLLEGHDLLAMSTRERRGVLGRRIALVPQSPLSALNTALPLRVHFQEAWRAHSREGKAELHRRLTTLLDQVQLPADDRFLARKPLEVSVGQAQRVVLALALLHRPALLIADEPTSALDPSNRDAVLNLLYGSNQLDGTALLYISHDLLSVLQLCHRVGVLHEGRLVESVAVDGIEESARHPATLALLRSLPVPAEVLRSCGSMAMGPRNSVPEGGMSLA